MILPLIAIGGLAVHYWRKGARAVAGKTPQPKSFLVLFATHPTTSGLAKLTASVPLGAATRQSQLRVLASDEYETSPAEQRARRNFRLASVTFVVASVGTVVFPILLIPAAGGFLYLAAYIYRDAYRAIRDRRLKISIVHAVVLTGILLKGFLWIGSLAVWLYMTTRLLTVKTEDQSLRRLVNLFGDQTRDVWIVRPGGVEIMVPLDSVEIGDVIVVSAGNVIPTDGEVVGGRAAVDQHLLTGESQPIERSVGDAVFACTTVQTGRIMVRVEQAGKDTVAGHIAKVLEDTAGALDELMSENEVFIDSLTLPMLAIGGMALPIAGAEGALAILWNIPGHRMEQFGPLSMLNFLHVASRYGILMKDGRSLEGLQSVDTVVFDKTGTLTLEQPEVAATHVDPSSELDELDVLWYAAAAEFRQTHPIARAILDAAVKDGLQLPAIEESHYQIGYGIVVDVHDCEQPGDRRVAEIQVGSVRYLATTGVELPASLRDLEEAADRAGHTLVLIALDGRYAGAIELRSTVRPEASRAITRLRERGLHLYILSGDREQPTRHLASMLGIEHYYASVLPEDKARIVAESQEAGRRICYVGDGINDSIALKRADVSVSLRGATTIATDTAQIVLMGEHALDELVRLFDLADSFRQNMKSNFTWSVVNGVVVMGGVFLFGWGMPAAIAVSTVALAGGFFNAMRPLEAQLDPAPLDRDRLFPADGVDAVSGSGDDALSNAPTPTSI